MLNYDENNQCSAMLYLYITCIYVFLDVKGDLDVFLMRFTPPDDRQQAAVESVMHRYIYI